MLRAVKSNLALAVPSPAATVIVTVTVTATLHLRASPQVQVAGTPHRLQPTAALLLAWLALEGATARERLASLLWPASTAEARRSALRQRLFSLRKTVSMDLVCGQDPLALAPGIEHDLEGSPSLLGTLAAPAGCDELADWLATRRAAMLAQRRQSLAAQIDALEATGDAAVALPLGLSLLQADPLSEDAHRRVMRLHYLCGDRAAALLAFDQCEAVLKHEVGTTPSAETLALLHSVQAGAEPAAPRAAPGWHGPLPASVLRPPRLIGRDSELARLQHGWQARQVLAVTGEAGIGKSRLLQALAHSLDGLNSPAMVSARPGDSLVPYASMARLLRAVLAQAPQSLAGFDPAALAALDAVLPGLVADAAPDATPTATPGAQPLAQTKLPRRGAVASAVQALLWAARDGLDGLVLDDLHFADEASLDLLKALLTGAHPGAPRSAEPLRWCLGSRPAAAGTALHGLMAALAVALPLVPVPLQALSIAQLAELVDSLALPGVNSAALAPVLFGLSGPQAGDIAAKLPRPHSLAQLIGQQLARLSAPALALARVAAVAGVDFSLPLAENILSSSALALADPWHELETQQVMVGIDFAHDLIFEAVLNALPAVIARHLHGQVARWLEQRKAEPARVAAHWEAAGQRARALPGLRAAAERAHQGLRERERIDFLLRAADIAESTGDTALAFDCVAQAIEAHMNAIRQADGFPLLDRLDGLVRSPAEQVQALSHRAWYCSQLPDHARAVGIGEQALALAKSLGERRLIGPIQQRLATSLSMLERFDEALVHLRAVQGWADDALAPDARAEFQGNFAVVLDNLGRPEEARAHHQLALADSLAQADHAQRTTHLANHAVSRLNAGDVAGALLSVQQAQQLVASFELEGASVAFLWLLRSQGARALGHYRDALAAAEQAAQRLQVSNPARLPLVHLQRTHIWLELGQPARAGHELHAVAQAAQGVARLPAHVHARRLLLQSRWQRALGQDPHAALEEAVAAAPRHGWPETRLTLQIEQALDLPDADALALLHDVRAAASALGLRGSVLASWLGTALAAAASDPALAGHAAEQALQLATDVLPTLRPRSQIWLNAAQGLAAAGLASAAAAQAAQGRQWLLDTAALQMDAAFSESFLQRGPGHADLLRLATTLA